ncbi:MAG: GNAT family N-acetyltransferase [Spirochaetales bacterium]|nr:GNAT family N-acetyltransferase [Spirochaetales bacterium]
MLIRNVKTEDYKSIHTLSLQLGYNYPIDKVKSKINDLLNNDDHFILVAVNEEINKIIGYIHLERYRTLYSDDLLNILGIVVEENYRNKGIGSMLLAEAEKIALIKNCIGIRANSGTYRKDTHIFYQKKGFEDVKDQKRFVKYFKD